jgi:hypothetical protein
MFISRFISDIGSQTSKEEIIAVIQSYYLKRPDMFIVSLNMIPDIVTNVYGNTSDIMKPRQYILVQILTNYRGLPEKQQEYLFKLAEM